MNKLIINQKPDGAKITMLYNRKLKSAERRKLICHLIALTTAKPDGRIENFDVH